MMSSQLSGGMGMMPMGPPGMSRQVSNASGTDQPSAQQSNVQHSAMMNGFPQQSQMPPSHQNTGVRANGQIPPVPHAPPTHNGGLSAMMSDASRMSAMGVLGGGMNMGGMGTNVGMNMGMSGGVDAPPRTPQRNAAAGPQMPGYNAMGTMSGQQQQQQQQQQHRQQPSTPSFSPRIPAGLQPSMMQSLGTKPPLDPMANMGLKMGGLPPLGTGTFTGLESRPAGLPSRIPSAAPPQHINPSMAAMKAQPTPPGIQPVLPPLPTNVQLNPQVTHVTIVPLARSDKTIPPLSQSDIKDMQAWREADRNYEAIWRKMKDRMAEEHSQVTSKAAWWEKDAVDLSRRRPREQFDVRYPRHKRDGRDRRKTGRREGLRLYVFLLFPNFFFGSELHADPGNWTLKMLTDPNN